MIVLLPPSESKLAPAVGAPADPGAMAFPELAPARAEALRELVAVSGRPDAAAILKTGPKLAEEVARNTRLPQAPAAPAHQVYTGVLFEGLDAGSLPAGALDTARTSFLVQSALWGPVALGDRIPAYRLSMGTSLGKLGALAAWWRARSEGPLRALDDELALDCRSGTYAQAWRRPPETTVAVNVFRIRDGKRTVVTHWAKQARGQLARVVALAPGALRTPQEVAALAAADPRWDVDLAAPDDKKPWSLELTVLDPVTKERERAENAAGQRS